MARPKGPTTKQITLRLEPSTIALLEALAKSTGGKKSDIIHAALNHLGQSGQHLILLPEEPSSLNGVLLEIEEDLLRQVYVALRVRNVTLDDFITSSISRSVEEVMSEDRELFFEKFGEVAAELRSHNKVNIKEEVRKTAKKLMKK